MVLVVEMLVFLEQVDGLVDDLEQVDGDEQVGGLHR